MKIRIILVLIMILTSATVSVYAIEEDWSSGITIGGVGSTHDRLDMQETKVIETSIVDDYWDEYSFNFGAQKQDKKNNWTAEILVPIIKGPIEAGVIGIVSHKLNSVGPFIGYKTGKFDISVAYNQLTYNYNTTATDTIKAAWDNDPGLYINNQFYKPGTKIRANIIGEMTAKSLSLRGAYQLSNNIELVAKWSKTERTTINSEVEYKIKGKKMTSYFKEKEQISEINVKSSDFIHLGIAYSF